jgi:hypothetical protein
VEESQDRVHVDTNPEMEARVIVIRSYWNDNDAGCRCRDTLGLAVSSLLDVTPGSK